ncbi:MAG: aminotransferase class V-fold PLP-dependent enzyme, partial [Pyramidobacter sp.]|nr:aminotransferase class V-fold PLP-dependent enzyme [Pyramidobacter sp.]
MSVYFNNAATSWPKPPCVAQAMKDFLDGGGANCARGTGAERDIGTMSMVLDCRERLARLFGGWENASPQYVTFTSGVTESLNIVLKGSLKPGMTV